MNAETWKKIEGLCEAALARPEAERDAFLDQACGGDTAVRGEVESLLRAASLDDSFLDHSPLAAALDRPALSPGDTLGVYRIAERIGRGGMGEVYRAHDPRLARDVAIKILPLEFARDPERLRRFEREAHAASALNHPSIVAVYDVGSTGGVSWMVTELVPGRSLREVLAKGSLPPRRVAAIGAQIADGLAAAHSAGLVHRDLKAENVMLAPNETAKILDFGIAKRRSAGSVTQSLTAPGEVVGTPACMSPEQVLGEEVDHRSDIFSLGVLLYEMLCGKRPFGGDTYVALMNAIVSQEPAELPAEAPETIAAIVHRCLEKAPERRFQSAADLGFALRRESGSHRSAERKARRRRWPAAVAAVLLASGLVGGTWWIARGTAGRAFQGRMRRLTWDDGLTNHAVISADGKLVAYSSDRANGTNLDIYVQQIDGGGVVRLTNGPSDHDSPTFTPDGSRVAFEVDRAGIYEAPALGGDARLLVAGGRWPRFSPDGRFLLYSPGSAGLRGTGILSELYVQPLSGGEPAAISKGCTATGNVVWSPDSERIAFSGRCSGQDAIWVADRGGHSLRPTSLTPEVYEWGGHQWLANPPRLLLSVWSGDVTRLMEAPVSADGSRITAPARFVTVMPGVIGDASEASSGRIVYTASDSASNLWRLAIDAQGRAKGDPVQVRTGSSACMQPTVSRDGRNAAFTVLHTAHVDLTSTTEVMVANLDSGAVTSVDRRGALVHRPSFGPRGDQLFFNIDKQDGPGPIMEVSIRGGVPQEFMDAVDLYDWSPDGSFYVGASGVPGRNVVAVNAVSRKPVSILEDPEHLLYQPHLSPDGRWVVFNAGARGRSRIYLAPIRWERVPFGEWIPLTDESTWDDKPRFSVDGRLLFFISDRDGFRCIWRQRLKADMHPVGEPEPVYHFHSSSRRSLLAVNLGFLELGVGAGVLVFNAGEARSNVWMFDPK